ncbi:type IV secretion system protein [Gilliamella sp. B2824]|uniref:type IV secretion system protein n=1 Tax=Gilliamella sp. B2824 TaxID=2818019 RepID=UPI00226A30C6|nr:type IV secretion system protein [Gilliamella sp. B2824]MCX8738128.1 type IV secretion system protein [Gilliamella sp. B2824]
MAFGDSILTSLHDNVSKLVDSQIASNITSISTAILPLISAAIMVYCVYVAWQIVTAQNDMFITDILKNIVMIVLVGAVCYSTKYYQTYVTPFVLEAGDNLSSALFGDNKVSTTMLDEFMAQINKSLDKMQEKMKFGWRDNWGLGMQAVFYWLLLWITSGVFALFATAYLLVAKLMVAILLSVGPIFICLSIFPVTRSMFTSWCGQCANYILLTLGYCIVLKLFISFINEKFKTETLNFEGAFQIVIVMLIGVYILGQVGTLISSLTGGVGINSLNGNINSMLGRMGGGLKGGAKATSKMASSLIGLMKGKGG